MTIFPPLAALQHVSGGELGETKHGGQVDIQYFIPVHQGKFDGGRASYNAGVVYQNIDATELFQCGFDNPLAHRRIRDVPGNIK